MRRDPWHIVRNGDVLTLARHLPPRFDVVAETRMPRASRGRLASQIRQDVWRSLQGQKGFSPVIEVRSDGEGLSVRAGGRVSVHSFNRASLEARIAAVLEDPKRRSRWLRCAGRMA
ncbi:hypothetical protein [Tropicimonas marinistellae]|uniref:hypothetical protein n=1 Tax=Tropicimonas marinistellae TaxID=1739787 RepID=UPI00082A3354|nr:hypothetical protein [Tropicimonas marinistellae]